MITFTVTEDGETRRVAVILANLVSITELDGTVVILMLNGQVFHPNENFTQIIGAVSRAGLTVP